MNLINYLIFILPLVEICDASRVPAVKPVKEDLPLGILPKQDAIFDPQKDESVKEDLPQEFPQKP